MPKKPNPARIKRHRVYTVWEVGEALGLHRQTVIRWIKSGGLAADRAQRPWLVEGCVLKAFLQERRALGRCTLKVGEIFCLPCRSPQLPDGRMADFRLKAPTHGTLTGLCPVCGRLMHRALRRADLEVTSAILDVAVQKAMTRLMGKTEAPSTVTFGAESRDHVKTQIR